MKKCIASILFFTLPSLALAQFTGGSGDGYDGAAKVVRLVTFSEASIYGGGTGDGHSLFATSRQLASFDIAAIYGGGAGDGHDLFAAGGQLVSFDFTSIYGGGAGDGHDLFAALQQVSSFDIAAIYGGGAGDGHDLFAANQQLASFDFASIYGGGPGDGHDLFAALQQLSGFDIAAIYGGGTGDGHDMFESGRNVALPLTLLAFGAEFTGDDLVLVTWTTTDERGTDFFVVERATDAVAFSELGEVEAAGQGRAAGASTDYNFADAAPLAGTGYYRLRIHDADGAVEFSEVVALSRQVLAKAAPWQYTLYPNPNAGNELYVAPVNLPADPALEVEVRDALGRLVYRATEDYPSSGKIRVALEGRLSAGSYLVRVRSGEVQQTKILVVTGGGA